MYKEYKTEHYIFHYKENSLTEADIIKISKLQEDCFSEICDVLKITFDEYINYWLCDTPEEVGKIYGDNEPCNGFAMAPDTVYAVYNDKIKCIGAHEDAHLISYKINIPDSCFLREGLAMFFDRTWWGIVNREWTAYFYKNHLEKHIIELIIDSKFNDVECGISYPIAGAFAEYLITRYGIKKYIEFYKCSNNDFNIKAKETFGKSIDELDNEFWSYIETLSIDESMENRIETLMHN